jgi:3-deoxy-manno-octulosonate cytidylyltransferase (CMP-KDO synthetase)
MSFKVVIPARYASTRLPAKAVQEIAGRPMLQWVIRAAERSGADQILVATDDERVAQIALDSNGHDVSVMTRSDHQSGTDRIAEVAHQQGWDARTIVVNVQGDEPQLPSVLIDQVATLLARHPDAHIATLCTPITSLHEFMDPNVVKVVTAGGIDAMYFSRAPIPWHRDGASQGLASQTSILGAQRHLGIYAYRVEALRKVTSLPPSDLEVIERLEQLRALQAGMRIVVDVATEVPGIGVDTPQDLERVRAQMS